MVVYHTCANNKSKIPLWTCWLGLFQDQSRHKLLHLHYGHDICCATILGWQIKTVHNDSIVGEFRMMAVNPGVYSQLSYPEGGRSQKCTQYENASHGKDKRCSCSIGIFCWQAPPKWLQKFICISGRSSDSYSETERHSSLFSWRKHILGNSNSNHWNSWPEVVPCLICRTRLMVGYGHNTILNYSHNDHHYAQHKQNPLVLLFL